MAAPLKLRILHISDLHTGKEKASGWRSRRVLGQAWANNLKAIAADGPVDLVCFTGDIAQSGQPDQYLQATAFVHEVLNALKVPLTRFFCVPGNHDIDRNINKSAWQKLRTAAHRANRVEFSRWMAGGAKPLGFQAAWRESVVERQATYRQWLRNMGLPHFLPANSPHGQLGYRVSLDVGAGAPLNIIGLDSAWLAGDEHDTGQLRITDEQLGRLLTHRGAALDGWSIALLHHPLKDLADKDDVERHLADFGVGLVLHGHLHDPKVPRWTTPSRTLNIAAAGCLYEDDVYPNSCQLLTIELPPGQPPQPTQLWSRTWSKGGHWFSDNSLHPGSHDGKLSLLPTSATPGTPPLMGGQFIGRESELAKVCAALLPPHGQPTHPTLLCCAIEGMAGVGKTCIAEHFVQHCWMPAIGQPLDANPAECYLRLVLPPASAGATPTALDLAQQLADRMRSTGPAASLWTRLAAATANGPGGKPWLLLIENVDSPEQAHAVGELVNQLPGSAVLVSARFQHLGGQGWARVPVLPMTADEARQLLLTEIGTEGRTLSDSDINDLLHALGRLPLALHIAASHLRMGWTPRAFLSELRRLGLDLPAAEPADPRLTADRARAIVKSSFLLSWQVWCQAPQGEARWPGALVALSHGPATATGDSLAAAITGLDDDSYCLLATAAARLSLLMYDAKLQHTTLHPLIAEFLRNQAGPSADDVLARMSTWFMARLPETGDAAQGERWRQIGQEQAALNHWLAILDFSDGVLAERAGQKFALGVGPYAGWLDLCLRLLEQTHDDQHTSNLWWTAGRLALSSGDPTTALHAAQRKQQVDQQRGDQHEAALAIGLIADILSSQGKPDEAMRLYREEELPVYKRLGDVRSQALTLGQIADILRSQGQLDEAMRIHREEELPVYKQLGDVHSQAVTLGQIAEIFHSQGQLDKAMRIHREETLPVFKQLGDVHSHAATLSQIADILCKQGEVDKAMRIYREEVLPVFEQLGDIRSRAIVLGKIADILRSQGQHDEAMRIRRGEVLPVYEKLGDALALLMGKINLVVILVESGRREHAAEIESLLRQAYIAASQMKSPQAEKTARLFKLILNRDLPESLS